MLVALHPSPAKSWGVFYEAVAAGSFIIVFTRAESWKHYAYHRQTG